MNLAGYRSLCLRVDITCLGSFTRMNSLTDDYGKRAIEDISRMPRRPISFSTRPPCVSHGICRALALIPRTFDRWPDGQMSWILYTSMQQVDRSGVSPVPITLPIDSSSLHLHSPPDASAASCHGRYVNKGLSMDVAASCTAFLFREMERHYDKWLADGFPMFPGSVSASSPVNASPYVVSYTHFLANPPGSSKNAELIDGFCALIAELQKLGIIPIATLLGGSFLRPGENARDIDCVIFYRHATDAPTRSPLAAILELFRSRKVDARLIPYDTQPALVLSSAVYFASLYSIDRPSAALAHGSVLISFPELQCA